MSHSSAAAAATQPPLGRLHDVSGTRLAIHRDGAGAPAVVFLPGAGLVGLDYLDLQARVAERTTGVVYDRSGTGWSDPVPLPRRAAAVAEELRALLEGLVLRIPRATGQFRTGGPRIRHGIAAASTE